MSRLLRLCWTEDTSPPPPASPLASPPAQSPSPPTYSTNIELHGADCPAVCTECDRPVYRPDPEADRPAHDTGSDSPESASPAHRPHSVAASSSTAALTFSPIGEDLVATFGDGVRLVSQQLRSLAPDVRELALLATICLLSPGTLLPILPIHSRRPHSIPFRFIPILLFLWCTVRIYGPIWSRPDPRTVLFMLPANTVHRTPQTKLVRRIDRYGLEDVAAVEAFQEPFLLALSRYSGSRLADDQLPAAAAAAEVQLPSRASSIARSPANPRSAAGTPASAAAAGTSSRQSPSAFNESIASLSAAGATPALDPDASAVATPPRTSSASTASQSDSLFSGSAPLQPLGASQHASAATPLATSLENLESSERSPRVQRFARLLHLLVDVRQVGVQCASELLARSSETVPGNIISLYHEMFDRVENLQPRRLNAPL